ncbi:MAG: DHH family phosphoesterase [Lachnospiraceae bacterium]|nr:DHH family phosphoesterase [Lachnospiraceae bacterium]
MKKNIRIKGRLRFYLRAALYMGILLLFVNVGVFMLNENAGWILAIFSFLYYLLFILLYVRLKPVISEELVNFATEYGQVQKRLLKDLALPHALLDDEGKIIWGNTAFEEMIQKQMDYKKSVTSVFPSITRDKLPADAESPECELDVQVENRDYHVKIQRISMRGAGDEAKAFDTVGFMYAMYFFDETALHLALREIDNQSLSIGLMYLDNYDEALESVEEVRRSLLIALIDRKVNKYVTSLDGICKKLEKDKYLVILRKSAAEQMKETRFEILDEVKTVNIGNEMAVTLSIGVGMDGLTYSQNYEFARNAIDLALGRGGDQAVVKNAETVLYFGGKSQQVEKNTKVKARVKAQALREIITSKDTVLIMGHRLGDVDSFGSAIGIYRIAKTLEKRAYIVINDITSSVQPLISLFQDNPEYEDDMFVNSQRAIELADSNAALVVVDVDKPSITECPELLKLCKSIIVLDHHRKGSETIENATLSYVEAYASSACEMVSEILQYIGDNIKIRPDEADCMYSGIMIDTNNFMTKTGVRTFEAAAFLRRNGADVTRVRKLFREDANEYKARADAVSQAEIYRGSYAISTCVNLDVQSPTVLGAQAANELLNMKGVKASFVLTEYQNQIYVSARSIDEVNVQVIMERLGGGGHMNVAGCQMEDVTLTEAIAVIKETLDTMIEEGEIQ